MNRIEQFIALIRGPIHDDEFIKLDTSHYIMTEVFTSGNCGNFAMALRLAFGGELMAAVADHHIVCRIEGRLYDITGDVTAKYPNAIPIEDDNVIVRYTDNYSFDMRGPIC